MLTMQDRAAAFAAAYPQNHAAHPRIVTEQGRQVLYATWVMGNNYRATSELYGAYPPGYVDRVMALFPDAEPARTLHAFSGSLPEGNYLRCDSVRPSELQCSVTDLPGEFAARGLWPMRLVAADPPYSKADAERYGTPMVDRRRAVSALAQVTTAGGHLAWLDTVWPIHRKAEWVTVGRILVVRSTNHRVRLLTIFERAAAGTAPSIAPTPHSDKDAR